MGKYNIKVFDSKKSTSFFICLLIYFFFPLWQWTHVTLYLLNCICFIHSLAYVKFTDYFNAIISMRKKNRNTCQGCNMKINLFPSCSFQGYVKCKFLVEKLSISLDSWLKFEFFFLILKNLRSLFFKNRCINVKNYK